MDSELCYFERRNRENNMDVNNYVPQKGTYRNRFLWSGRVRKDAEALRNGPRVKASYIVLSFTNKACENVRQRLSDMGVEANAICHTFDSYFCDFNGRSTGSLCGCGVFV